VANFEMSAGNGRLYPMSLDARARERERMDAKAAEGGNDWLKVQEPHDYDGFFKIDQSYVNFLQAGLAASDEPSVRVNLKGYKAKKQDGSPQLNMQDPYIKGVGTLKNFVKGSAAAPAAAPAPAPADDDPFDDDEAPF